MTEIKNQKPCLVQTGQGFSVEYNQKLLYSKYNPSKQICMKIDSMDFLPGTLILGFSAVLNYGIENLAQKLPENCLVILCEADRELSEFSLSGAVECDKEFVLPKNYVRVSEKEMYNLPVILQKASYTFSSGETVSFAGNFKRVIRIDFSAGVQFHSDFYNRLEMACVNSVKQFWTNRFTLAKFGRRYSRNMFRNLKNLPASKPLEDFIGRIERPVFVFGAGESAEKGIEDLQAFEGEPYVLCADTAFQMLKANGIMPDGIVVDEAQSIIAESFIGAGKIQVFQSLCSLPHVAGRNHPKDKISFYGTEYAQNSFFEGLKEKFFFPPVIPAFGSVGITAYILACLFRKDDTVPVYFYGLDFAYSTGKTHGKGTPAHKRQLLRTGKTRSTDNLGACFGGNVLRLPEGFPFAWTTPILSSYAETFRQVQEQNRVIVSGIKESFFRGNKSKESIEDFLKGEKVALSELRDLLSGKIQVSEDERARKIRIILENRQYLYLHFPDGYRLSTELSFLKRVRGEIDGFLKFM
ncbi:MAG: DUF115 domain-containing protein [Treponema sp.]|nr:DUF115 domain-containing protein [Treponema sp.]